MRVIEDTWLYLVVNLDFFLLIVLIFDNLVRGFLLLNFVLIWIHTLKNIINPVSLVNL